MDAEQHCAFNVGLYGTPRRWCMTERGAASLQRGARNLAVGPSALAWRDGVLEATIDEYTVPWPRRLRGRLTLTPQAVSAQRFALDANGRHDWGPIAPAARIEVDFDEPALRWSGTAYLDMNRGAEPLEAAFADWQWQRAHRADGSTEVHYDIHPRNGPARALALRFDAEGRAQSLSPPPLAPLRTSRWRVERCSRSDAGHPAQVLRTFEDAPFYARSLVAAQWDGEPVTALHESLSLDRFNRASTRCMLPFRMPRAPAAWRLG